jgi:hypothetical protein
MQPVLHFALIAGYFHVNKVNHHQSAQIPKTQLPRDFVCSLKIRIERRLLNI